MSHETKKTPKSMLHSKLIYSKTPSRWHSNMPIKAHMEEGKLTQEEMQKMYQLIVLKG